MIRGPACASGLARGPLRAVSEARPARTVSRGSHLLRQTARARARRPRPGRRPAPQARRRAPGSRALPRAPRSRCRSGQHPLQSTGMLRIISTPGEGFRDVCCVRCLEGVAERALQQCGHVRIVFHKSTLGSSRRRLSLSRRIRVALGPERTRTAPQDRRPRRVRAERRLRAASATPGAGRLTVASSRASGKPMPDDVPPFLANDEALEESLHAARLKFLRHRRSRPHDAVDIAAHVDRHARLPWRIASKPIQENAAQLIPNHRGHYRRPRCECHDTLVPPVTSSNAGRLRARSSQRRIAADAHWLASSPRELHELNG